jgi:flagellar hook-associated protein 1 FlgK
MSSITQALRNASSGLLANQQSLNTVANNISNVNTVGYSKKIINFENVSVAGRPAGVQISEITRQIDEGLLKTLRLETSELQASAAKEDYYDRLQDLFGSPGANTSISHLLEKLAESSELLALAPDKSLEASEFVRSAVDVTIELQQMSKMIQELRLQADNEITAVIKEMSEITAQIDELNDDIISNGTVGRDVTDLKDQRDLQIDRLSSFVDIRYFYRDDGDAVVYTSNGSTLVDTVPPKLSHTPAAAITATTTHSSGNISGIFVGSDDITNGIRGGTLKALVDMRDEILPNLQSQIDELAVKLRDSVNHKHNQGVSFPGSQAMTGSRIFVAPSTQTIKIDSANTAEDVKLILFDSNGDQMASTTLKTLLESASFGTGAKTANAAASITEVATSIQDWLQENASTSATASINASGKFEINLNTTSMNLAFRDEKATVNGSATTNASIEFDSNGDGNTDKTNLGFSYFFGLNDFFVDDMAENLYETDVLQANFKTTAATISFRDSNGLMGGTTYTVAAGTSLADLASDISTNVENVKASVISDGVGQRLRFIHDAGASMTITQSAGDTLLTTMNLHVGDVGVSANLNVRSDIISTPSLVATGQPIWDSARSASGEYHMSVGDDTVAQLIATDFATSNVFSQAGGLPSIANTFSQYAAGIVADNASLASVNDRHIESKRSLKDALQFKSDSVRGVNIDEEMADLIVFEQAFAAAARVISVIQSMMETLEDAVR